MNCLSAIRLRKGFEQLGNDKVVAVRLGGIYALESVMNTSEQYHQPVLEALCAFVREGTKAEPGHSRPATDIQAALTVIGRRAAIGIGVPDLSIAHIPYARLYDANLSAAKLVGANLSGANLSGADLSGADLGSASLSGAHLNGANLTGARLSDVNLTGANLDIANLSRADLSGATVSQTQLDSACGTEVKLNPGLNLKPC
jgi:hypothetical protein